MEGAPLLPALSSLAVAYGGTTWLVSPAARVLGEPYGVRAGARGNALLWLLCAIALAIALGWQRASLANLGLAALGWATPLRAVALTLALRIVFVPVSLRVVSVLRLRAFESGLERVLAWPLALRVAAVVTGGVVEETLFRACALHSLEQLGLPVAAAAAVAIAAFALLHLPFWGAGAVVSLVVTSAALTGFFLWQRDLVANALAHALVDGNAFVLAPWLAARARSAR
jgi:membrane protease YdiL (CAAX protease family)